MVKTRLAGVKRAVQGPLSLKKIYLKTLKILENIPESSMYRQYTGIIICHRLRAIEEIGNNEKEIEEYLNAGRMEMLLSQAEAEYQLSQKMTFYKPWEPLVQKPLPNQWKWPPLKQ